MPRYSWDKIIEIMRPFMIDEAPEPALRATFNNHIVRNIQSDPEHWSTGYTSESEWISDNS